MIEKRPIALCRCGQSSTKPFCDGTHRTCGFAGDAGADTGRAPLAAEARADAPGHIHPAVGLLFVGEQAEPASLACGLAPSDVIGTALGRPSRGHDQTLPLAVPRLAASSRRRSVHGRTRIAASTTAGRR